MKFLAILFVFCSIYWLREDQEGFAFGDSTSIYINDIIIPNYKPNTKCESESVWSYVCQNNRCVKVLADSKTKSTELNTCKLTCGPNSMLFPKPSGYIQHGPDTVPFFPTQTRLVSTKCNGNQCGGKTLYLITNAFVLFTNTLEQSYSNKASVNTFKGNCRQEAQKRSLLITVNLETEENQLTLSTDESYDLEIKTTDTSIDATISATTFFGARHGLETISQLTAYSEAYNSLQIVSEVKIDNDKPSYKYRGLLLDTSRNYFSVQSILNTIRAMSYNKMNTLHWHITDTHSFPIEIESVPELSKYGMYSNDRVYKHTDIRKIVSYAAINGIRVLPEFDQPAHCGEGWQFGPKAGLGNLAVCVNREPWQKYCVEPPCGQLNPINLKMYEVLGKIYKEYFQLFEPDIFHAGGDEINLNCWNTTTEITNWMHQKYGGVSEKNFMDLWSMFLQKSSSKIYEANNNKELPLILWTSKMTSKEYLMQYMDPKKHIVQIWTATNNDELANIVENGFRTIVSTYDTLYLDCGYGNWLVKGNNWCSPYKDWKLLYENDPVKILKSFAVNVTEEVRKTILGQESAMWSEQVDENSAPGKIWPRTAALAERLWTNPDHGWKGAEYRFIYHRERLVERGVQADALQPLWCMQNAGHCYYDAGIKGEH